MKVISFIDNQEGEEIHPTDDALTEEDMAPYKWTTAGIPAGECKNFSGE